MKHRLLLGTAIVVGLAIRLGSVLARPHLGPGGDPAEYLGQANLLAAGKGWIEPLVYGHTGIAVQTAKLPPLYTMLLALCSLAGWKSFFAHRIWSAILSSGGVPLGYLLGREVARGVREEPALAPAWVGLLTAFGVAVYPNLWMSAGLGMSETVSPLVVMVVLILAYRMLREPSAWRAVALGASIGLAALARGELLVLVVLVLLPAARGRRRDGTPAAWAVRVRLFGAGLAAVIAVLAPWVAFNATRFSHPVLVSDEFGVTFAAANCPASWNGPFAGYWSMPCALAAAAGVHGDESSVDPVATRVGLRYLEHHLGSLPSVEFDRLGRTFGFWSIDQQLGLDIHIEGRPAAWAWTGLGAFYALAAVSPFGAWALRRRKVPLYPLAAVAADVFLVVFVTYGQTRFRATLEPVLVVLAASALASWWTGWRERRGYAERSDPTSGPLPSREPLSASAS